MLARLRPYIFLFLALSVIYHANFRPVDSSDSLPASLTPLALVLDHTICLDRFVPWLHAHVWYTPYVVTPNVTVIKMKRAYKTALVMP